VTESVRTEYYLLLRVDARAEGNEGLSTRGSPSESIKERWEMSIDGLDLEGLRMCAVDGMIGKQKGIGSVKRRCHWRI